MRQIEHILGAKIRCIALYLHVVCLYGCFVTFEMGVAQI